MQIKAPIFYAFCNPNTEFCPLLASFSRLLWDKHMTREAARERTTWHEHIALSDDASEKLQVYRPAQESPPFRGSCLMQRALACTRRLVRLHCTH